MEEKRGPLRLDNWTGSEIGQHERAEQKLGRQANGRDVTYRQQNHKIGGSCSDGQWHVQSGVYEIWNWAVQNFKADIRKWMAVHRVSAGARCSVLGGRGILGFHAAPIFGDLWYIVKLTHRPEHKGWCKFSVSPGAWNYLLSIVLCSGGGAAIRNTRVILICTRSVRQSSLVELATMYRFSQCLSLNNSARCFTSVINSSQLLYYSY